MFFHEFFIDRRVLFPTKKNDPVARQRWLKTCQRADEGSGYKYKEPTQFQAFKTLFFIATMNAKTHTSIK